MSRIGKKELFKGAIKIAAGIMSNQELLVDITNSADNDVKVVNKVVAGKSMALAKQIKKSANDIE